ncbi:MAG: TetR/AcrR family transcriptional regulator [Amphritea sp.]
MSDKNTAPDSSDNSPAKKNYHHGDLYQSLLKSATEMIGEGGVAALSMRKLADRVGVSRTAPYHHFKDKNELLCAIAEQGFADQEQIVGMIPAHNKTLDGRALFALYVQAYIQFADKNPQQYDLMFGRDIWKNGCPTPSLTEVSRRSFQRWLSWVETLQQQGVLSNNDSALRTAQITWATLHGLCRLINDGIYTERSNLEEMSRTAVRMLLTTQ